MQDVHAGLVGVFCDVAVELGALPDALFAGLEFGREALTSERRISWDEYIGVAENMAAALGGADRLVAVGEGAVGPEYTQMVRRLGAFFSSPEQIYRVAHRWWAPGGFRNLEIRSELLGKRQLRAEWSIPEGQQGSLAHFRLVEGALRALPSILGLPNSVILADLSERSGVYTIAMPPSLSLLARLRRAVGMVFAGRTAVDELSRLEDEIITSYRELGETYKQLEASEQRHRALVESASDIVVEFSEDAELLYVSPAVGLLGYEPADFIGRQPWDWIHPEDLETTLQAFAVAFEGEPTDRPVIRVRRSDGQWLWGEVVGNRYFTADGELRLVGVMRDVTERHHLEAERARYAERLESEVARRTSELESANRNLRELQTRLLEAERLGAGESLAGSVAHAINNPLSALAGTAELLLSQRPDAEIERILRLARRIGDVVARTLVLYREGRIRPTSEHAAELIDDVVEQVRARASDQGVEITLKVEAALPRIGVDRPLFVSALASLAENSLDVLPDGGSLLFEAGLIQNLDVLEFRVCDSGPGIPLELHERVFEPFFTTKGGGTGLGLSIVRGVVQGHGGRVRMSTRAGGGASISVQLPLGIEP